MNGSPRQSQATLLSRRSALLAAIGAAGAAASKLLAFEGGAVAGYEPNAASVSAHRTPDWFRDAKLGFSAQWTPQSLPEQGDWYAHNMYVQGSAQYQHHLRHYGHPSRFGYKDLAHLWTGEAWQPEDLLERYRRAGARYFVPLANHHDGFDCWDSRHQPWNSVNVGPRRDIVGTWTRLARAKGLKVGAAFFAIQNWSWFSVAHGSDGSGPLSGVPYDGALTPAEGRGRWWEGLDPRLLYGPPRKSESPPSPAYVRNMLLRLVDLIDQHQPDLIFYTDKGLPLGAAGFEMAAYQLNRHLQRTGRDESVIVTKKVPETLREALVWDKLPEDQIHPWPWQMDICIGDWHYKRGITYRTAADIIPYFVDIVSKNGNLLVNLPIRADGTLDSREHQILDSLAAWTRVNGEAVFDTRPWTLFGEGPTRTQPVDFPFRTLRYGSSDIRFTRRGDCLYAIALGWPADRRLAITALGRSSPDLKRGIRAVEMLGHPGPLAWRREDAALLIDLPERPPSEHAYAFRVRLS